MNIKVFQIRYLEVDCSLKNLLRDDLKSFAFIDEYNLDMIVTPNDLPN